MNGDWKPKAKHSESLFYSLRSTYSIHLHRKAIGIGSSLLANRKCQTVAPIGSCAFYSRHSFLSVGMREIVMNSNFGTWTWLDSMYTCHIYNGKYRRPEYLGRSSEIGYTVVSSGYRSSSRKSKEHKIAIEPYLYICMHVSVAVHSTMRPLNTATNQVDELPASIVEENYKHG